jgi:heme-degrading monooxygenase HmoA
MSPGRQASLWPAGFRGAVRMRDHAPVICEHAVLDVRPGEEAAFEAAFAQAKMLIAASPGFRSLRLSRCIENSSRFLLLVEWETLADHLEGFRGSAAFGEWRRLLHHFYDPAPTVEHFDVVAEA